MNLTAIQPPRTSPMRLLTPSFPTKASSVSPRTTQALRHTQITDNVRFSGLSSKEHALQTRTLIANLAKPPLEITNLDFMDLPLTAEGLAPLGALQNLKSLNLWGVKAGDAGIAHLKVLQQLETLILSFTNITDAALQHLSDMSKLSRLDLVGNQGITDAGLPHLSALPSLTRLSLWSTSITDRGLVDLAKLPSLKELDLEHTQVTAASLETLKTMTQLRQLKMPSVDYIKVIMPLQKALPKCDVGMESCGGGW